MHCLRVSFFCALSNLLVNLASAILKAGKRVIKMSDVLPMSYP